MSIGSTYLSRFWRSEYEKIKLEIQANESTEQMKQTEQIQSNKLSFLFADFDQIRFREQC
jgi:hypothetical protein